MLLLTATNQDVSTLLIKSDFSSLIYTLFFILNYAKVFGIGSSTAIMPGISLAEHCTNKTELFHTYDHNYILIFKDRASSYTFTENEQTISKKKIKEGKMVFIKQHLSSGPSE